MSLLNFFPFLVISFDFPIVKKYAPFYDKKLFKFNVYFIIIILII